MSHDRLPYEIRKGSNVINPNPVETVKIPRLTHDELLARLNRPLELDPTIGEEWQQTVNELFYQVKALRAVVELHKPTKEGECKECRAVTDCSECYGIEFVEAPYPCPTIQAIEKELG